VAIVINNKPTMDTSDQSKMSDDYKKIIIDVFREFISICEQNNLNYFCCGGTAIGVVRHKGMIPWDDDIDVLMPRVDYDHFLALMKENCPTGYEIVDPKTYKNYYLPFAKFANSNTTIVEHKNIPCILGANIDIFPLDGAAAERESITEDYKEFKRNSNKLRSIAKDSRNNWRSFFSHLGQFQLRTALNELKYSVNKTAARRDVWTELEKIVLKNSLTNSKNAGNYGGMWGIKEFGPTDWFKNYVYGEFEDLKVRIPHEFDKLLTQMYGDYMVPPPLEKRTSHHHVAYINLNSRLTIEEVMERIR